MVTKDQAASGKKDGSWPRTHAVIMDNQMKRNGIEHKK